MSTINNQYATLELRIQRRAALPNTSSIPDLLKRWGMDAAAQESFWVITYDSAQNLRTVVEVARGGYRDVMVSIPAVMAAALKGGADRFVVAHNHPSGDTTPTSLDMDVTRKIMDAANVCGLYFEDHFIVAPHGQSVSLAEEGFLVPAPDLAARISQGAVKAKKPRRTQYLLRCVS